ncbi:nodulation protein NodZ [Amphritea sp. HPY]|uniref:nodulation protein NodZ n=1 Tax=Amphritea sp. HPY TaxID=3421652 RepID=UPI003D7E2BD0
MDAKDIDLIRDAALLLEKEHLIKALHLMQLAKKLRPEGAFIAAKCEEYLAKNASGFRFSLEIFSLNYLSRKLFNAKELDAKDIDLIKDAALILENEHLTKAWQLMELAKKLRPDGPFIAAKCKEYLAKIASGFCFSQETLSLDYRNKYLLSNAVNPSRDKFVVSADINDIYSGLGCMLLVLAPAWKYAKSTGRILIIDWRNSPYVRSDSSVNLFSRLFDPSGLTASGVKVIADDQVDTMLLPNSLLLSRVEQEHESGILVSCNKKGINNDDMISLLQEGVDSQAATFLPSLGVMYRIATKHSPLNQSGSSFCTFEEAAILYGCLKPRPQIQQQIDFYSDTYFSENAVIGLHIRHGNGEELVRKHFSGRVISGFDDFIDNLVSKIDTIARKQGLTQYKVFLCTDSDQVALALRDRIPDLLTRDIWRPENDKGVDFDHPFESSEEGVKTAANALIDMQLLSKCDVAILTRPTSFACQVPYLQEKPNALFLDSEDFNQI